MKLPDTAAELIAIARKKKNMNQEAFATFLGSKQSLISRYESGEIKTPPSEILIRTANIFIESSDDTRRERQLAERLISLEKAGDTKVSEAISLIIDTLASHSRDQD